MGKSFFPWQILFDSFINNTNEDTKSKLTTTAFDTKLEVIADRLKERIRIQEDFSRLELGADPNTGCRESGLNGNPHEKDLDI